MSPSHSSLRRLGACAGLLTACGGPTAPTASSPTIPSSRTIAPGHSPLEPEPVLRLDFLRDVAGWLIPCGCSPNQRGGLHHLGALLAGARKSPAPEWLLASGPLFYSTSTLSCQAADQKRTKAQFMAESMSALGLTAWAPGRDDYADGRGALGLLAERSRAIPLSGGAVYTPPSSGTISVGLVGITSPHIENANASGSASSLPLLTQYERVAEQIAASPPSEARLWVALAAVGRDEARRLAERVPALAVIAVGSESNPGPEGEPGSAPELHNRTWLIEPENHGQSLGSLELLALPGQRLPTSHPLHLQTATDGAPSPPPAAHGLPFLRYYTTPIEPALGTDPRVDTIIQSYTAAVQTENRKTFEARVPVPAAPGTPSFVGALSCASCHDREYRHWMGTTHASAYDTLVKKSRDQDLECVGCHVTGYELPGGSTVSHVGALRGIQCEACHGPASLHARKPYASGKNLIKREPAWCRDSCHRPPHVLDFDAERKLDIIMKEGHGVLR